MLRAILEHYSGAANVEFAVTRYFGTYSERARYGLRTKLDSLRFGRSRIAAALMPASFRQSFGLASEADIAAVLDASGFAFGDQLGPERTEQFAGDVIRWKQQGKPVVLLPQACGPFESPRLQRAMRDVVRHADRVYARDVTSLAHLRALSGENERVRLAPDFTCLVRAALPDGFEPQARQACIVPNHRMIEKTSAADRDRYVPFLVSCLRELERRDLQPYVLLHDSRVDESLVLPLERAWGLPLRVVRESDPSMLKGILGTAHVVIGSRFHALVSALSQAVPSIAVGWSHKYERLLADYGCPDCLLSPGATDDQVRDLIGRVVGSDGRNRLIAQLKTAAAVVESQTRAMWVDVDAVLGISPSSLVGDRAADAASRARNHVSA
jgi:colanic acid/amylovoran biosynthesis protein